MTASDAAPRLLAVDDLRVVVAGAGTRADAAVVDGVSFTIAPGETVALVGESGAGKTMLALALMGLLPDSVHIAGGSMRFDGAELVGLGAAPYARLRGNDVAMIFQDPQSSLHPAFRVGDQIAETLRAHGTRASKRAAQARAVELLALVGIPQPAARARDYPHQLSGGMRQRVMIAMAIANHPRLLIADEATTALDVTVQAQVLDVLRDAQRETDAALLLITHDLGVVAGLADRVIVLYAGAVVEEGTVDAVLGAPAHPYTQGLLAALPRLDGDPARALPAIPGVPPSPFARPAGCAFHPRCAYADERCAAEVPVLEAHGAPGQRAACHHAATLPCPVDHRR